MTDEHRRVPDEGRADRVERHVVARAREHAQIDAGEVREELGGVGEVALGHDQEGPDAGVERRDEGTVDETLARLGIGRGDDDEHLVGVGDDDALDAVGVVALRRSSVERSSMPTTRPSVPSPARGVTHDADAVSVTIALVRSSRAREARISCSCAPPSPTSTVYRPRSTLRTLLRLHPHVPGVSWCGAIRLRVGRTRTSPSS